MDEFELPSFVSHGTPNAYINYWCRCTPCREAHSRYRRERRASGSENYVAYMREYMRKYRARKRDQRRADPKARRVATAPGEDSAQRTSGRASAANG